MIFTLDNEPSLATLDKRFAYLPVPSTINSGGETYPLPFILTNAPVISPLVTPTVIRASWPLEIVTSGLLCALIVSLDP